ncbi:phenylacetate--CoA ligase family protein [Aquabacterium sp. A7-Y]|uniref:phenylacetate--CoA ligase family protein n=1 Tax=Aquabacterium sp. A7-Y TaxID=1349605 RepID=UPI00223D556E|nr:phenylacetate--CoA ligase family protein [Aquabacterium sp. A7-Y]MCW7539913.1 phenylacetate--CoA ligase family protein [Aquabacterium sp. A7-Y]
MSQQPPEHYDSLEGRDPQEREAALMRALAEQVAHAQAHTAAYAELLAGVDAREVTTREALRELPVTRKHELLQRQQARRSHDAFGGHATVGWRGMGAGRGVRRVFQSPGPLYEPEGAAPDYWRAARALHAAGVRAGDLVHNSFSYHLTPAGSMMEGGALALGCAVFPGGTGQTELQLQAMHELRPQAYVGTPGFLKILLDRAEAQGQPLRGLSKALVSGEACPAALRDWFGTRGIVSFQCYATADLGLVAYETSAREGLVLDETLILEILAPGSGEPVAEGHIGEVVVTTLNRDYPLIRFATGDLSAVLPGPCPTGRTNTRLKGWLGRADQSAKVRGMFVHAAQLDELLRRHPEVARARLVVSGAPGQDCMTLRVELAAGSGDAATAQALGDTLRELTRLRGEVELLAPGTLPADGRLIEDMRRHD